MIPPFLSQFLYYKLYKEICFLNSDMVSLTLGDKYQHHDAIQSFATFNFYTQP